MHYLKNFFHVNWVILTMVMLSGCSSDDTKDSDEQVATEENIAIISFDMLSKDHSFSVIKSNVNTIDSLVICLFPSPVDYANITPTLKFEGTTVQYRINNEEFNAYSASVGRSIDFSYPNTVDFKITNSDDSNSKVYRIIVDTEQPILFNNSEIMLPDSPVNISYEGLEIDSWTNVGNYPIRVTLRTSEYADISTPETGLNNIFSSTLSKKGDGNLNPMEQGSVNVFAGTSVTGTFSATALFNIYFQENLRYIVYDPVASSDYILDIGYKPAQLKMKGNFVK